MWTFNVSLKTRGVVISLGVMEAETKLLLSPGQPFACLGESWKCADIHQSLWALNRALVKCEGQPHILVCSWIKLVASSCLASYWQRNSLIAAPGAVWLNLTTASAELKEGGVVFAPSWGCGDSLWFAILLCLRAFVRTNSKWLGS